MLKQSLRAGDLVLNSPFNGRISKPDYPLAWSIKRNATYLDDSGGKGRETLLCTFLRFVKSLSGCFFFLIKEVRLR